MAHYVVSIARNAGIIALFVVAAMLGILSGVLFAYAGDLPQISALDDYTPSTITRVYASNGQVIGEFATQRRVIVGYDDINPVLRQAIIATEDAEFDRHFGINLWRMVVAAVVDLAERRRAQGASTLTQQLARNLKEQFGLTNEKSLERKIREIILAIQIEKRYTKKEIFTIYCNQMYLGHGAYGVEAASRLYFNKSNKQLSLEEAALIAGIFQTPERQSPFVDMKRATSRRNVVLQRMADERYITQTQADAAKQKPIVTRGQPTQPPGIAPFFVEEVRKHLERQYGAKVLYEKGLAVTTTLDARLQEIGNRALEHGLRAYDKRHGYRKPKRNVMAEGHTVDGYKDERWSRPIAVGDIVPAVVVTAPKSGAARLRVGPYHADLARDGYSWTRRTTAADLFTPGDLIDVAIAKMDEASNTATVTLDQTPIAEGALVAHRQPHRSDQGDGRRVELQPQQVQPRRAGVPAARVDLQADRLHRGDRSRLHARVDPGRRAGQLLRRERSDLQPAQLRSQVRRPDHAAPRARGVAQRAGHQDDGHARSRRTSSPTRSGLASRRTSRPICRLRSARATRRCSR